MNASLLVVYFLHIRSPAQYIQKIPHLFSFFVDSDEESRSEDRR
jgi:hypothetical protein